MKVSFEASFARDLKRIRDKQLKQRIQETIDTVKEAAEPGEVRGLRKLQGHQTFYRIRLGNYRVTAVSHPYPHPRKNLFLPQICRP
jgi:mRNA interferase RelE/StbE